MLLLGVPLILSSCQPGLKQAEDIKVEEVKVETQLDSIPSIVLDLNLVEYVSKHSKPRKNDSISLAYLRKDTISVAFREKYLFGKLSGPSYDSPLPRETWPCYFWKDYVQLDSLFYFSFVREEETCCKILYGVTVHLESNEIIDISMLALEGGDGGWYESDYGKWIDQSTLEVVEVEYYNELDPGSLGLTLVHYDTTWVSVKINSNGHFSTLKLDSVSETSLEKLVFD